MVVRKLLVAVASSSLLAGAVAAVPAHASRTQESIFQDDTALISQGDASRQRTLDEISALGATTVHALVFWGSIAPDANSRTRPAGFDATNPNAYPPGAWSQYDALVGEAHARGLQLILSPVRAPAWAGRCGRLRIRDHCNPDPREYQAFVEALGKRYSGVRRWSFWNEPNQARALQPQQVRRHGRVVPQAAVMYRNLFRAGVAGLRASGHGGDQVLLGETAPLGQRTSPPATRSLTPGAFYQGLFCLDSHGHPLRGRAARDEGCGGRFAMLPVSGVAHHPYSRAGSQSPTTRPGSGEITIATLGRLGSVINQGARAHRIPGGLPFYFTEFGFQTNPPDRLLGVSLSTQARWINESDWIAYRNPRVRSVAQYELFDDRALGSFQTGLRFWNGRSKPSLAAYRLPIWVTRSGSGVQVWGQVRPADGTPQTVQILNGRRSFRRVRTVRTSAVGYFNVRLPRQPGPNWRLAWTSPEGARFLSRTAGVA
jgi:hypothetical protein